MIQQLFQKSIDLQLVKSYVIQILMIGLFIILCISIGTNQIQVVVDYSKDPYTALPNALGSRAIEVPDNCDDKLKHITSLVDPILKRTVFVHNLHVNSKFTDGDRCNGDYSRQRCETSVQGTSPDWMKGYPGSTFTFAWKVFLPADFRALNTFCHIHQIKNDGVGGTPNLTLTVRTNDVQLENEGTILAKADINSFKGNWVQIREKITYGKNGYVDFTAHSIKDGKVLMSFKGNNVKLDNKDMIRPKFGFYRSLEEAKSLKDDYVRMVDLCIGQNDACHYNNFGDRYTPQINSLSTE